MCRIRNNEILYTGSSFVNGHYPFILNTENFSIRSVPYLPLGVTKGGAVTKYKSYILHFGGYIVRFFSQ